MIVLKNMWDYRNKLDDNTNFAGFEDNIIKYIFDSIENKTKIDKKCIEFGANNGSFLSNTRKLILDGWESIQIEPDTDCFNILENLYKDNDKVICVHSFISNNLNDDNSLDNLISKYWKSDSKISFISIDVDGEDFNILKTIKTFFPILILVENNSHLEPYLEQGMTTITNWGKENGYELLGYTGNLFLLKKEYVEYCNLEIPTPQEAYERFFLEHSDEGRKHQSSIVDVNTFWRR